MTRVPGKSRYPHGEMGLQKWGERRLALHLAGFDSKGAEWGRCFAVVCMLGQVLECYCGICSWVCGTGDPQGEMGLQKWTEKKGDPHVG